MGAHNPYQLLNCAIMARYMSKHALFLLLLWAVLGISVGCNSEEPVAEAAVTEETADAEPVPVTKDPRATQELELTEEIAELLETELQPEAETEPETDEIEAPVIIEEPLDPEILQELNDSLKKL